MAQTSIHLKPCKLSVSEAHNKREAQLNYVRPDLSHRNEWWSCIQNLSIRVEEIKKTVKEKTGRKMQAKATPIHEAVVVIKEDTTMKDIQEIGKRFKQRFGVELIQVAIHRDEGHWVNQKGESTGTKPYEQPSPKDIWKPNLHAHLLFDWYNHETGKSIKTTRIDASAMQDIVAEVLGMERGISSSKKHLDAAEYKIKQRQNELEKRQKELDEIERAIISQKEIKSNIGQINSELYNLYLSNDVTNPSGLSKEDWHILSHNREISSEYDAIQTMRIFGLSNDEIIDALYRCKDIPVNSGRKLNIPNRQITTQEHIYVGVRGDNNQTIVVVSRDKGGLNLGKSYIKDLMLIDENKKTESLKSIPKKLSKGFKI